MERPPPLPPSSDGDTRGQFHPSPIWVDLTFIFLIFQLVMFMVGMWDASLCRTPVTRGEIIFAPSSRLGCFAREKIEPALKWLSQPIGGAQ